MATLTRLRQMLKFLHRVKAETGVGYLAAMLGPGRNRWPASTA